MTLVLLPLLFLKFWFFDAPVNIIGFFGSLNRTFFQLFSLPLLIHTYFRPWKNEYREGLVAFAIGMGMFIKTFVILADFILFVLLLTCEMISLLLFLAWPIATVVALFLL